MSDSTVKNSSDTITAVIMASILFVVMLLALVLIVDVVTSAPGKTYNSVAVTNETGYANQTGYTLSGTSATGFRSPVLTQLINATDNKTIGLGNATVTASGVVYNATTVKWDTLKISYTYEFDNTTATNQYVGMTSIKDNTVGMVVNFFVLMPTIGTIMAVVILIAAMAILIIYVIKMRGSSSGLATFSG